MPSTYAHYRFGQDVLKALPAKYRDTLLQEEDLFNIGLHGPDLLFYYKPFSQGCPQGGLCLSVRLSVPLRPRPRLPRLYQRLRARQAGLPRGDRERIRPHPA